MIDSLLFVKLAFGTGNRTEIPESLIPDSSAHTTAWRSGIQTVCTNQDLTKKVRMGEFREGLYPFIWCSPG